MRIALTRLTARLLWLALLPLAAPIRLWRRLFGPRPRIDAKTLSSDPFCYEGSIPLVVSIWASWATVWRVRTEQIVNNARSEFGDRCEFIYIDGTSGKVDPRLEAKVLPIVLVYHQGKEAGRFVNLIEPNRLRELLNELTLASDSKEPGH